LISNNIEIKNTVKNPKVKVYDKFIKIKNATQPFKNIFILFLENQSPDNYKFSF